MVWLESALGVRRRRVTESWGECTSRGREYGYGRRQRERLDTEDVELVCVEELCAPLGAEGTPAFGARP
jgi:hypothetical protein